jgi:hypothetical protein
VLGRAFFLQLLRCVTIKATIHVIISGAPFSSIFNHLRYSLNTSHKAFRHVTTAHEMRRPVCEVLNSLDALRLPSPVPEECHSRFTNQTVYITLGIPNSKALKRVAAIIQQYRDRYRRPPAVCIPTDKLSLQPIAPTIQLLLRTHESMRTEKI